jgi:hypothetical protein
VDPLFRFLERKAFHRGMRGRSVFLVLGAALWMVNRARHSDRLVYRTRVRPGDRFVITSSAPGAPGS